MSPSGHFRAYNFITGKYIIMHLKWWHKFLRIIKDHILCAMPTKLVLLYDDYLFHHAISNKWLSFMTTVMTNGSALCNTKETDCIFTSSKMNRESPALNQQCCWFNKHNKNQCIILFVYHGINISVACFCVKWQGWKEATRNKIYHNVCYRTLGFPDLIFDIVKNLRYKEVILL